MEASHTWVIQKLLGDPTVGLGQRGSVFCAFGNCKLKEKAIQHCIYVLLEFCIVLLSSFWPTYQEQIWIKWRFLSRCKFSLKDQQTMNFDFSVTRSSLRILEGFLPSTLKTRQNTPATHVHPGSPSWFPRPSQPGSPSQVSQAQDLKLKILS